MINRPNECIPVSGRNLSLLTLGLYLVPIGESAMRACAAALGGDQFDEDDPTEFSGKVSFFNWFQICISLGGFLGLVVLVWVQDNKGWGLGFMLAAIMVLVGTIIVIVGLPFYRHRKPTGSPVTRIFLVYNSIRHLALCNKFDEILANCRYKKV
jgi:dipeptide/tripeptide permease